MQIVPEQQYQSFFIICWRALIKLIISQWMFHSVKVVCSYMYMYSEMFYFISVFCEITWPRYLDNNNNDDNLFYPVLYPVFHSKFLKTTIAFFFIMMSICNFDVPVGQVTENHWCCWKDLLSMFRTNLWNCRPRNCGTYRTHMYPKLYNLCWPL